MIDESFASSRSSRRDINRVNRVSRVNNKTRSTTADITEDSTRFHKLYIIRVLHFCIRIINIRFYEIFIYILYLIIRFKVERILLILRNITLTWIIIVFISDFLHCSFIILIENYIQHQSQYTASKIDKSHIHDEYYRKRTRRLLKYWIK